VDPTPPFPADPRSLPLHERRAFCDRMQPAQRNWQLRLRTLCEAPPPPDFPCFLLATPALRGLAQRLAAHTHRRDLPTGLADELDRFVDAFADYLRSAEGEDAFQGGARRAG
jgi:hypothetical protein